MTNHPDPDPDEDEEGEARLLDEAAGGDPVAAGALLERHRPRLLRIVALRLDRRLRGRVDPADVLQEGFLDAIRRLPEYAAGPSMPFFLWLRFLILQRLVDEHRKHLGALSRDAEREIRLDGPSSSIGAADLAARLLGQLTTPSAAAIRAEQKAGLHRALDAMDETDREILTLRHFEMLSNGEAAAVLGLKASAASRRYTRALLRLKEILDPDDPSSGDGRTDRSDRRV